ncbi:hypothetical protein [Spirochaeta cellobiosiphila]|uniref:hypothetical protein n=1 Tax=Spirochaeta cellobiosiphila TaxID=504483 RepID=UPI00041E66FD|nr:hypothetical protein [Spirochaeta cellobiosiphila]
MKKYAIISILIGLASMVGAQSFNASFGADFTSKRAYVNFGGAFVTLVSTNTEFEIGSAVGIQTEQNDGNTEANFIVPVNIGLNFVFPFQPTFDGLVGIGLEPTFLFPGEDDEDVNFLLGPSIKLGTRVKIHDNLKWYVEAKESMLIGPPDWINLKTTVSTGFNFSL